MVKNKRAIGAEKESLAADYLVREGYTLLEHNFCCRTGEIDLVAKEGNYLVFVEVKYRAGRQFGVPEEAVTAAKQRSIIRTAQVYLLQKSIPESTPCRFDVLALEGEEIRLIRNAFEII